MNYLKFFSVEVDRFYPYSSAIIGAKEYELCNIPHNIVGFLPTHCTLSWDNKICFRLKVKNQFCYIGFYDCNVFIGLDIMKNNYDPKTHYVSINQ